MSAIAGERTGREALLARERAAVEGALRRRAAELAGESPSDVAAAARYALEAGGKRLRPVLCLVAFDAASPVPVGRGHRPSGILDLACGLELVHTYSLVHDDLPCMDDDALRRGRPTTHRVYGSHTAVLAGLALIPAACALVRRGGAALGLSGAVQGRLVRELCAAAGAGGMVGGQLLDLEAEGRRLNLEELEDVHRRKTGALLACSLKLGAIAAGGDDSVTSAIEAYGRAIGLAFQIADDLLDVTGRSTVLGKAAGRDELLGKATFPALLGLEAARARAHDEVERGIRVLRNAGIASPELESLGRYAVERDR